MEQEEGAAGASMEVETEGGGGRERGGQGRERKRLDSRGGKTRENDLRLKRGRTGERNSEAGSKATWP